MSSEKEFRNPMRFFCNTNPSPRIGRYLEKLPIGDGYHNFLVPVYPVTAAQVALCLIKLYQKQLQLWPVEL